VIEADRDKLVKLLRMFSSDFDGEVASAARRAHGLVMSRKLDWADIIVGGGSQPRDGDRPYQRRDHGASEGARIRRCNELSDFLSAWESQFIESIGESLIAWGRLTEKQAAVLNRIVEKLKNFDVWEGEPW
jgi:hypothetical protein